MFLNFSNEIVRSDATKRIFLAGPTLRDSSFDKSWRNEACKILEGLDFNGIVYIPEFSEGVQTDYDKQVKWEWEALSNSTKIVFWIPRNLENLPGFTTNVEFGMKIIECPEKVLLGYPNNAIKMRYIESLYNDKTGRKSFDNLIELLAYSIS